jgi:hypothetical protein
MFALAEKSVALLQQSVALAERLMSPANPRLAPYRAQLDVCLNNLSEAGKPASTQASRTN